MSNPDNEFKNVKKGLPAETTPQKTGLNFVFLFTVVGVVVGFFILLLQDSIISGGARLKATGNNLPEQILVNSVLAFLVGSVQAWIFKGKIKSRAHIYLLFSALGGFVAGLFGGSIMNDGIYTPFVIGLVNGAVAGAVSSWGQNKVMRNSKYGSKWLIYSIFSWAIIYSIVWIIGWKPDKGADMALAALFLMIANGVGLAIFINNTPQIEFS